MGTLSYWLRVNGSFGCGYAALRLVSPVGALIVPADGDGKIGAIKLAGAAPGALFHFGGNRHIHPLGVELLGEPDGLPRAEMHADPASLTEFLIYENFTTFHSGLLRRPISNITNVGLTLT
jgi:hypothetical protein